MLGTSVSTPVLTIKWEATGEEDAGDCGSPQEGKSLAAQASNNPIQRIRMKAAFLTQDNLDELTDFEGYRAAFLNLHGFDFEGVDYTLEQEPDIPLAVQDF